MVDVRCFPLDSSGHFLCVSAAFRVAGVVLFCIFGRGTCCIEIVDDGLDIIWLYILFFFF